GPRVPAFARPRAVGSSCGYTLVASRANARDLHFLGATSVSSAQSALAGALRPRSLLRPARRTPEPRQGIPDPSASGGWRGRLSISPPLPSLRAFTVLAAFVPDLPPRAVPALACRAGLRAVP